MAQLVLMLVIGMLTTWSQPGAAQVATGARPRTSSTAKQCQSDGVTGNVYRVTGPVVDDVTGKPLSGAKVTLTTVEVRSSCVGCGVEPAQPHPEPPRVILTGSDGRFDFEGVPGKLIHMAASRQGYADVLRPPMGTAPPSVVSLKRDRNFVLRLAAASISGIARDHNGALLGKNGDIALYIVTYWEGWPQTQYAGWPKREADGTYRFDGLVPGRYFIVVSPPWNRPEPERIEGNRVRGEVPVRCPAPTPAESVALLRAPRRRAEED
jgi:hypothetical protein